MIPLPMVARSAQSQASLPAHVRQAPAAQPQGGAELPPAVQLRNALKGRGSAANARELDERPFPTMSAESTFSLRDIDVPQSDETFVQAREVADPRPMLRSVASRRERSAELIVELPEEAACEAEVVGQPVVARRRRLLSDRTDDTSRASRIAQRIAQRYPNALQPC